jgi:uncharacterized membrane protein YeaQ/YmgE (transglycosylase-associated protein family)
LRIANERISFERFQEARPTRDATVRFDPTTTFLIVLVIGVVLGLVFDHFLGRGWLARRVTGGRQFLTSALVGVAGSFVGYHIAMLLRVGAGWPQLLGAAIGALVVLWVWRMAR